MWCYYRRRRLSITTVSVLQAIATGYQYGFDVIDHTGLPSGTVYPALSRLERDGYVPLRVGRRGRRPCRRAPAAAQLPGHRPRRQGARGRRAAFYRALLPARPRAVRS